MKRTKFIAGALVLSMGLLGTGYAYWTDALQVKTTVSTGKLDVEVTGNPNDIEYIYDSGNDLDGDDVILYGNQVVTSNITDQKIEVNLPNMHPGTKVVIPYTITNNSTMPIIGKVSDVTTTNETLLNMLQIELWVDQEIIPVPLAETEGGTFEQKLQEQFNKAYVGTINPNNAPIQCQLIIRAPKTLKEEFKEEETMSFSVTTKWTQHNDYETNSNK